MLSKTLQKLEKEIFAEQKSAAVQELGGALLAVLVKHGFKPSMPPKAPQAGAKKAPRRGGRKSLPSQTIEKVKAMIAQHKRPIDIINAMGISNASFYRIKHGKKAA